MVYLHTRLESATETFPSISEPLESRDAFSSRCCLLVSGSSVGGQKKEGGHGEVGPRLDLEEKH